MAGAAEIDTSTRSAKNNGTQKPHRNSGRQSIYRSPKNHKTNILTVVQNRPKPKARTAFAQQGIGGAGNETARQHLTPHGSL